jgi:hypothetical protein
LYVYALETCTVGFNGRVLNVTRGLPWRADDPFVKARPELFSRKPPITQSTVDAPVERATQVPGEKRRARRG